MRAGFTLFAAMLAMTVAHAQQPPSVDATTPKAWRPVAYTDLSFPTITSAPFAALWADAIKKNNETYARRGDTRFRVGNAPATESHVVIRSPSKTAILSVLNTVTGCHVLATDPTGYATLKKCPMRLATYEGAGNTVNDAGSGCFIEYTPPPANTSTDTTRNVAYTSYDVAAKTLRVGVIFQKAPVDDCQINVPIPQRK